MEFGEPLHKPEDDVTAEDADLQEGAEAVSAGEEAVSAAEDTASPQEKGYNAGDVVDLGEDDIPDSLFDI